MLQFVISRLIRDIIPEIAPVTCHFPVLQAHLFIRCGRRCLQAKRRQLWDEGHSWSQLLQGHKQPHHWQRGQKGQLAQKNMLLWSYERCWSFERCCTNILIPKHSRLPFMTPCSWCSVLLFSSCSDVFRLFFTVRDLLISCWCMLQMLPSHPTADSSCDTDSLPERDGFVVYIIMNCVCVCMCVWVHVHEFVFRASMLQC